MRPVRHPEESLRVQALREYGVLDAPRSPRLEALVALASKLCETPIAFVNLIDGDRQCFVAEVGLGVEEAPRDPSVCDYAIQQNGVFEIPDAERDPRFHDWPQLTGENGLRFYAGAPLRTAEGLPLGTLCVMDRHPRSLSDVQRDALQGLADHVMGILDLEFEIRRLERGRAIERTIDPAEQAEAEFLRTITDRLPVRVGYIDHDFRYVFLNGAYERMFGFAHREAWGRRVEEIVGVSAWTTARPFVERALAGETNVQEFTAEYPFGPMRVEAGFVADHGPDGKVRGVVIYGIDVTARYEAQQALAREREELATRVQEATAELRETVREAESFNYSIAHDLRAPLRAIVATARILSEDLGPSLDETYRTFLDRQTYNANRLARLIDELLRLSRLSRVPVVRETIDLTAQVRMVAEELDPLRPVEVENGLRTQADRVLLHTVLENLIGNAFKFSKADSTVKVGRKEGAFFVRDEGVGFDMKYASKLFLPFERLVTEQQFEGTGIGLANVERIVKRHGGRIWAESQPGQGATFWFTLE